MAMDEDSRRAFLRALQLADGTLPIGRFAHSYGVEAWLEAYPETGSDGFRELVRSTLAGSIATLDGAAVALSHAAASSGDLARLRQIDAALTARKHSEPARSASTLCGMQLASLAGRLGIGGVIEPLSGDIDRGACAGNLAVVEGAVGAAMEIAREETVLVAVRGHAAAMLAAAVRLGRLGTSRSQALLYDLASELDHCARVAMGVRLENMRATLPELEIHAARQAYREARLFMS
jgi:urease accessory protein